MSLVDVALLPIRVGRGIADALLQMVVPESPAPPSELFVVDGMPEGVPAAALRPEPELPAPAGWPFGEEFPRTCGTGRFAGGALFWTDFFYDDHGADGVRLSLPSGGAPPRGTYTYPDGRRGPQRRRHLPSRHRAHRCRHVVAGGLEHAARPVCARRAVHVRHRPRDDDHRRVARRCGCPLRRHRHGTAGIGGGRTADRPHDPGVDSRRAHRRHVGSIIRRPGSALVGGARRHLDGPVGRRAGERRGRRVRRRSSEPRRQGPGSRTSTTSPSAPTSRRRHT